MITLHEEQNKKQYIFIVFIFSNKFYDHNTFLRKLPTNNVITSINS